MHELTQVAEKMKLVRALIVDADGCLTDGVRLLGPPGDLPEYRRVADIDAWAIALARAVGWKVIVLAAAGMEQLAPWCTGAGVDELHGSCHDRRSVVDALLASGYAAEELAYLGSDLLDLPAMAACGLQVAPRDAGLWVRKQADVVLASGGGRAALRELVERILEVQSKSAEAVSGVFAQLEVPSAAGWLAEFVDKTVGDGSKIGFRR